MRIDLSAIGPKVEISRCGSEARYGVAGLTVPISGLLGFEVA
jgi:hypothetical protein